MTLQSTLSQNITDAQQSFESTLVTNFSNRKNQDIYKYVSSFKNTSHIPPVVYFNSTQAISDSDKANLFNHFSSLSTLLTLPQILLPTPLMTCQLTHCP